MNGQQNITTNVCRILVRCIQDGTQKLTFNAVFYS